MTILAPQEVLQAIIDGKGLECRWYASTEWKVFIPTEHPISTVHIFNGTFQFRLAQETITIGDVSFPKPVSEPLELGADYWIATPDFVHYSRACPSVWLNTEYDLRYLRRGLVHLSMKNAELHAKALITLSGGEVK